MRTLSSAASALSWSPSSSSMVWFNALPRSGRLSVTVAMRRGEMSTDIVCNVTFTPCAGGACAKRPPTYDLLRTPIKAEPGLSTQCVLAFS